MYNNFTFLFQPVLVSNCQKSLDKNLWIPNSFLRDFGKKTNDLVNCRTGVIIVGHTMADFWEGFEYIGGEFLLLKIQYFSSRKKSE